MAVELKKIEFKDFQEPAVDAENLNQLQDNIEEAINEGAGSGDGILTGSVIGYSGDTIPEGYEEVSNSNFGGGLPIGSGCDYFGTVAPENYMFADGRELSRTEYEELFNIIGETYGSGDGSTTFNIPDKRERVSTMYSASSDTFDVLGKTGGSKTHVHPLGLNGGALIRNNGNTMYYTGFQSQAGSMYSGTGGAQIFGYTHNNDSRQTGQESASGLSGVGLYGNTNSASSLQPYIVCNYIIKVK